MFFFNKSFTMKNPRSNRPPKSMTSESTSKCQRIIIMPHLAECEQAIPNRGRWASQGIIRGGGASQGTSYPRCRLPGVGGQPHGADNLTGGESLGPPPWYPAWPETSQRGRPSSHRGCCSGRRASGGAAQPRRPAGGGGWRQAARKTRRARRTRVRT